MGFESSALVREYFQKLLEQALESLRIQTKEATERYLVELLAGYADPKRSQALFVPFVEQLGDALQSTGKERAIKMRCLGDGALFVSGFMADSCERRGVSNTYVITIGSRAYYEAGTVTTAELAGRFSAFAQVLDEVRELTSMCTDETVLAMYEKWSETHSPKLLKRLVRRGVNPSQGTKIPH